MAFSTASSTATMPVTYACLRDKVGLREESASMGALVGCNFNNDGTALYEAMAALFVSQLVGRDLSLGQQLMVVLTSIIASVGAAGIPEAGIVTMPLVLRAVHLPDVYIPMLLTVDWFLDRCRTTVNVMGDMNVACLLEGKTPPGAGRSPAVVPLRPKDRTPGKTRRTKSPLGRWSAVRLTLRMPPGMSESKCRRPSLLRRQGDRPSPKASLPVNATRRAPRPAEE